MRYRRPVGGLGSLTDVPDLIAKQDIVSASTMAALLLLRTDDGQPAADTPHDDASRRQP